MRRIGRADTRKYSYSERYAPAIFRFSRFLHSFSTGCPRIYPPRWRVLRSGGYMQGKNMRVWLNGGMVQWGHGSMGTWFNGGNHERICTAHAISGAVMLHYTPIKSHVSSPHERRPCPTQTRIAGRRGTVPRSGSRAILAAARLLEMVRLTCQHRMLPATTESFIITQPCAAAAGY